MVPAAKKEEQRDNTPIGVMLEEGQSLWIAADIGHGVFQEEETEEEQAKPDQNLAGTADLRIFHEDHR